MERIASSIQNTSCAFFGWCKYDATGNGKERAHSNLDK